VLTLWVDWEIALEVGIICRIQNIQLLVLSVVVDTSISALTTQSTSESGIRTVFFYKIAILKKRDESSKSAR
jgi:hypothetical protein